MRHGMGGAEILLKGHGTHHGGHHHIASRLDVIWVFHRTFQVVCHKLDTLECDGVAHGVKILHGKRLDVVGESIHAGIGG